MHLAGTVIHSDFYCNQDINFDSQIYIHFFNTTSHSNCSAENISFVMKI